MADPTTPDLSALSPATTEEAWRKDPAKGFIRPEGPKLVRDPTPQPAPAAAAALKRDPTPLPKRDEAPQPAPAANSYLSKAIEPITTYLPTQRQMAQEGVSQIGRGLSQLFRPDEDTGKWSPVKGAANIGLGAYHYTMSPIDAGLRTIVGTPIETATGGVIKKEWPEFAAGLALMGFGGARSTLAKTTGTAIQKVLSPESVSPEARASEAVIREESGGAARDTAITESRIEPFHKVINKLPTQDRWDLIDYIERRSTGAQLPAYMKPLQPVADVLREEFEKRAAKISTMSSSALQSFVEDYFPHMWKDPGKAQQQGLNYSGFGLGKQGSAASLQARSVPTVSQGRGMGLEPISDNPLEMTMRYIRSMDKFIASQRMLEIGKGQGAIRYIKPKVYGASGRGVGPENIPDGWVPIKGRGAINAAGAQAYAPADWARVYNNYLSQGIHGWSQDIGQIYDAARKGSNAITTLELGLSAFHAATMAQEAIVNGTAKGISEIVGGSPLTGLKSIAKAPAAPVTSMVKGKKIQDIYLGRSIGTPDYRRITELLEKAGGRAVGKEHALDYEFSAAGNYWKSFKRGALKMEFEAAKQTIKQSPLKGTAKVATQQIGRIMETVAAPLFEKYIPLVKNGAFYENMSSWLKMHPNAGDAEQVAAARQIWNSIDNRFGEMVQDNIFWDKTLKQTSMLAMRSYSWNMGTVRELGGGVRDIVQALRGEEEWSQRASYVIALPVVSATMNAAYQYLKTGEAPDSIRDLMYGKTGGLAPGVGGRGEELERAQLPSYMKDVHGWYEDWTQEAMNKVATGPRMLLHDLPFNQNWRGDPIINPEMSAPDWMQQYFNYVSNTFGPIGVRSLLRGQKEGSNISRFETILGIKPAPAAGQDPEGYREMLQRKHEQAWKRKEKFEKRQESQYGGTQD